LVFSSHAFLVFLLLVLLGYALVARIAPGHAPKHFLTLASLVFYGFWIPAYLLLLGGSVLVNYALAGLIRKNLGQARAYRWLCMGVVLNLGLIGYYKYLDFLITSLNWGFGVALPLQHILLPIGISFITFQKISFLVDTYRGKVGEVPFPDFLFFIAFFPQLIAGPIVTQSDFLHQVAQKKVNWSLNPYCLAVGFAIFSAGLFKKTILADQISPYADHLFNTAATGGAVGFMDAWIGAMSYSFQIYFDFSGYSDMAVGLAFLFGFRLPINFFSPYKAASIREFWRRWHISLSNFLRDYLYISFGGSRHGLMRTLFALLITMLLGGLWHGANITFLVWGGLHGLFLVINHLYAHAGLQWGRFLGGDNHIARLVRHFLAVIFVYLLVTIAWVFFRALDLPTALRVLKAMFMLTDYPSFTPTTYGVVTFIWLYFVLVWCLPNTVQIFQRFGAYLHAEKYLGGHIFTISPQASASVAVRANPVFDTSHPNATPHPNVTAHLNAMARTIPVWAYRLNSFWAILAAVSFSVAWFALSNLSPFIYFQF
jgi:alginate O-acetyltransferase complex protein AlgI